jgi:hypothetical protein
MRIYEINNVTGSNISCGKETNSGRRFDVLMNPSKNGLKI